MPARSAASWSRQSFRVTRRIISRGGTGSPSQFTGRAPYGSGTHPGVGCATAGRTVLAHCQGVIGPRSLPGRETEAFKFQLAAAEPDSVTPAVLEPELQMPAAAGVIGGRFPVQ
eukprot:761588-Hanusia_phi.AAC.1